ncbi:MAG: hypothetical protein EOP84_24230, partial [Verrucomicrobiaceae bacterium]
MGCTVWKTLEAHVAQLKEQHWSYPELLEPLLQEVPRMLEAGLLVSDETVRHWCRDVSPSPTQAECITAIGFPTGGKQGLELAPRAVRSFAENLAAYNRQAELIVCDSSLDAELREQYRARLKAESQELGRPVRYLGLEEKRQFSSELTRLGACAPEVAEFALNDPLETGFAPGANRNMLLLAQTGTMFCSVDHDVLCRTISPPESGSASLAFYSECDPFVRWTFADEPSADPPLRSETPDFLALHETLLGRSTHELITKA